MNVLVLLNAAAGTLAASETRDEAERIARRFQFHGVEVEVRPVEPARLCEAARESRDSHHDLIVAGGGDGTVNAVGSQLVNSGKPFGILPLGTLNQLAKEIGLPLELEPAIDALVGGEVRDFNVGEVNGQVFLSFSAFGIYSEVIKHRDAQRRVLGRKKWPAMVVAFFKMFTRWPLYRVRLRTPESESVRLTPLVFVGLSEHQIRLLGVADYSCRGREFLNVYLARATRRLGLVFLVIKGFFNALRPARDFEILCTRETDVSTRRTVRVVVDGEVMDLASPLRYRLVAGGLKLVVPSTTRRENEVESTTDERG